MNFLICAKALEGSPGEGTRGGSLSPPRTLVRRVGEENSNIGVSRLWQLVVWPTSSEGESRRPVPAQRGDLSPASA